MGVSLATVIKTFIWAVMTLEKSPSRARAPLISASLRRHAAYLHFFFPFLRPPSTLLIGRQAARAPVSVPPRAAVPLSPPRWMQGGRMPSQLAGESESFIDSAWPREERAYFSSSCREMEKKKETGGNKKITVFHPGHVYVCTSHVWCHAGTINRQRKHKTNDVGKFN